MIRWYADSFAQFIVGSDHAAVFMVWSGVSSRCKLDSIVVLGFIYICDQL